MENQEKLNEVVETYKAIISKITLTDMMLGCEEAERELAEHSEELQELEKELEALGMPLDEIESLSQM